MMDEIDALYLYLKSRVSSKANYGQIANLSFCLFCSIDILPEEIQSIEINKYLLAEVFSRISKDNKLINTKSNITDENCNHPRYWINLIENNLSLGVQPRFKEAEDLIRGVTE